MAYIEWAGAIVDDAGITKIVGIIRVNSLITRYTFSGRVPGQIVVGKKQLESVSAGVDMAKAYSVAGYVKISQVFIEDNWPSVLDQLDEWLVFITLQGENSG